MVFPLYRDINDKQAERDALECIGMAHFYIGNMDKAKLFHTLVKEGYDIYNPNNHQLHETVKIDIIISVYAVGLEISKLVTSVNSP